tara:strand:- start:461 stop:733 length:273 start_codon:yes stop_codon:yes gene_type:complete
MLFIDPVFAATDDQGKSSQIIKEAKVAYKQVVKLNNAWRDTKKLIKQASEAHSKKNYKKSISLANQALNQSKMAIEQHNRQKDNYRFLDQ